MSDSPLMDAAMGGPFRREVPFHIAAPTSGSAARFTPDPTTTGVGANATDTELERYVRDNYGYMGAYLNNPEVRSILFNAARHGWDEQRLYGRISQTDWWRSTSASRRTWDQLANEDPAEARRLVNQVAARVTNMSRTLGLGTQNVANISLLAAQNGLTEDEQIDALIRQVNWGTIEAGDLTATRDSIMALAKNYLVGMSEQTAQQYAERVHSDEMSMDGVESALRQQARTRFGWMEEQIDQGMTPRDYLNPLRDVIADELEVPTESIDMMNPKWLSLVEMQGEDGKKRSANMNEARLAARREPAWQRTQRAQEGTTSMLAMVSEVFGRSSV